MQVLIVFAYHADMKRPRKVLAYLTRPVSAVGGLPKTNGVSFSPLRF